MSVRSATRSCRMLRLAIIATHPIQYQVPWFQRLAAGAEIDPIVFYGFLPDPKSQGVGFGVPFTWDIPLLDGYRWEQLPLAVDEPRLGAFWALRGRRLGAVLRRWQPDVLLVTGWQSLLLIQFVVVARLMGLPIIVRGESNSLRERPWWVRTLHCLLMMNFDAFLTIGQANRDLYLSYGVDEGRLFDCRYFVDNARFERQAEAARCEREGLRARWVIPPDAVCFLYVGKLEQKKRLFDLLGAMELCSNAGLPVYLLVVGTGELESAARERAASLPVSFAGFLNQTAVGEAYVAADCLVLPSDYGETWGLVVNEAMASGVPAIVSDRVGCSRDLIREGETGGVFRFGDVEDLATRLGEFVTQRERLAEMGRAGRALIKAEYSVDQAVEGTLAAVAAVLKDRKDRSPGKRSQ